MPDIHFVCLSLFVTVTDISRPCQPEKLIPSLPWPGFDPSFSGHNDRQAITAMFVCWSLTSLCHSNGHIETMPAREINPFTALTRIRSQFLRTQWSTSNHSEWTRLRLRPLSHRGWLSNHSEWTRLRLRPLSHRGWPCQIYKIRLD